MADLAALEHTTSLVHGPDSPIVELVRTCGRIARSEATVLITGETGVGKEVFARLVHENSARAPRPLVALNCGAIPETLLESELFGHARGAFTGAVAARRGRIAAAHGGTLFLDEIGELPLNLQVKLLRVLQERCYEPVGATESVPADFRLVVATNRDLAAEVAAGRFRRDLYYRLLVCPVEVPPLRHRRADIPYLFAHFWSIRGEARPVDPRVLELLEEHAWPGNVRELENLVERLSVCSEGPSIRVSDLPPHLRPDSAEVTPLETSPARSEPPTTSGEVAALLGLTRAPLPAPALETGSVHLGDAPVDLPAMLRRLEDAYADFMTLLFAFFVVMYAVSRVDNKRLTQATNSIRWALHFDGTGGVGQMPIFESPASSGGAALDSGGAGPAPTPRAVLESVRRRVEMRLKPFLLQRPTASAVTVELRGSEVTVRLAAAEFFDAGQAALRPDVLPVLDALAEEVVPLGRPLRVEGHTDASPLSGGPFRDNWALSAGRAATVVSYLERAHHVRPELLTAAGYGASRPIAQGDDEGARQLNRRVEIAIDLGVVAPARPERRDPPRYDPTR